MTTFRRRRLLFITLVFFSLISMPVITLAVRSELHGMILLQVESRGEAWYVNPDDGTRAYLGKPDDALRVMRELGLGIRHAELEKYLASGFPKRLAGKILLDVERNGEAYYVYPKDRKGYYLGNPAKAFDIMRQRGLGISNRDIVKLPVGKEKAAVPSPVSLPLAQGKEGVSSVDAIQDKVQYVVQIICPVQGGENVGSGILIYGNSAADSKVVTNKHVLTGSTAPCAVYRAYQYNQQPAFFFSSSATFIFSNLYDLAVMTPGADRLTLYPATNVPLAPQGDWFNKEVFVLGYPPSAGTNITLTRGIVSGSEYLDSITMYKTDAKIDSGNSGGGVFDGSGTLIGIPTLASQGVFSSYGYIIPAPIVKDFLDLVEEEGYGKQNWQHPQLTLYTANSSNRVPNLSPSTPQNSTPNQQQEDKKREEQARQAELKREIEQKTASIKSSMDTLIALEKNCDKSVQDSDAEIGRLRSLLGGADHYDILQKIYAQEGYQRLVLDECVAKKILIIDNLITDIRAVLRLPNLPFQITSLMNQFLDILTLKRQRLVDWQYQTR